MKPPNYHQCIDKISKSCVNDYKCLLIVQFVQLLNVSFHISTRPLKRLCSVDLAKS